MNTSLRAWGADAVRYARNRVPMSRVSHDMCLTGSALPERRDRHDWHGAAVPLRAVVQCPGFRSMLELDPLPLRVDVEGGSQSRDAMRYADKVRLPSTGTSGRGAAER